MLEGGALFSHATYSKTPKDRDKLKKKLLSKRYVLGENAKGVTG